MIIEFDDIQEIPGEYSMPSYRRNFNEHCLCYDNLNRCMVADKMEPILDAEQPKAIERLRKENRKLRKCFEETGDE